MVKYVRSLNSGLSSGFPSFIFPYLEKYSTMIKTAQTSWVPIYIHVKTSVIHSIQPPISLLATSACTAHQITKNQMMAAERNVTTGLKRRNIPTSVLPIVPHFQLILSHRHLSDAFSSTSILQLQLYSLKLSCSLHAFAISMQSMFHGSMKSVFTIVIMQLSKPISPL